MIPILDTLTVDLATVRRSLRRPSLFAVEVAPHVQAVSDRVFGPGTTPVQAVQRILADVAEQGDRAVLHYTAEIDGLELTPERLFVTDEEIEQARQQADEEVLDAIRLAAHRIEAFHTRQLERSWFMTETSGSLLGQRLVPLERVGCYVPGGRSPLVSTALMSVVPARVAGVEQIIVATPAGPSGVLNPYMILALVEAGAHKILRVGGAQSIAALAYGTESVPQVDKIVGPGNLFVQLAKGLVFGTVGIDSLAGPSEILVIADASADPAWVAADMLSQAEHDTEAAAILITTSGSLARDVADELDKQLAALPDPRTARSSLERWGRIVTCRNLDEAVELANLVAPEHLELMVEEPHELLGRIKHAGAVFLGPWSSEPIGDYIAGPNHILPTNGTARFASALSVGEFFRRSGLIQMSRQGMLDVGPAAVLLARLEGLEAHARALEKRLVVAGGDADDTD